MYSFCVSNHLVHINVNKNISWDTDSSHYFSLCYISESLLFSVNCRGVHWIWFLPVCPVTGHIATTLKSLNKEHPANPGEQFGSNLEYLPVCL